MRDEHCCLMLNNSVINEIFDIYNAKKKPFSIIFSFRFSVGPPLVAPWGPKNLWSKALYM